jgi:hypothetical protein
VSPEFLLGTALELLGLRYRSHALGRFLSLDPLRGSSNRYSYAGNAPATGVDPSGLEYQQWNPTACWDNFTRCRNAAGLEWWNCMKSLWSLWGVLPASDIIVGGSCAVLCLEGGWPCFAMCLGMTAGLVAWQMKQADRKCGPIKDNEADSCLIAYAHCCGMVLECPPPEGPCDAPGEGWGAGPRNPDWWYSHRWRYSQERSPQ